MNTKFVLVCLLAFIIGLLLGAQFTKQSPPPYLEAYGLPQDPVKSKVPVVKEEWFLTNVSQIIKIQTPKDIEKKRKELINYIWKDNFPKRYPHLITSNVPFKNFSRGFEGFQSFDIYEVNEKPGFTLRLYHLKTNTKPKNKLIIFHNGDHPLDAYMAPLFLSFAGQMGYDVLALSSPLHDSEAYKNNYSLVPVVHSSQFGSLGMTDQNIFFLLREPSFSALQLYLDPIAVSLNFIDEQYDYESYHFVGVLEGSWEATVYPAIDPRIKTSHAFYPPLPFFVATNSDSKTLRNYEYLHPLIYKIANYPELYVLASFGDGRKYVHLIDKSNPTKYNEEGYLGYGEQIAKKVKNLNHGEFEVRVFSHTDTPKSITLILGGIFSDIEGKPVVLKVDTP